MSDALDRLTLPGVDLLERVDAVLTAGGLPVGHPVTGLLRRLGSLPTDVLRAVSGWRPAPLRAAASDLRRTADGYEQERDHLATPVGWAGTAGDGFGAQRATLVDYLGDTGAPGEAGLVGRLRATAAYLDDVAEWQDRSRRDMAYALADVLGSAEAVGLHATGDVAAAATIAARILAASAEAHSSGQTISERWAGRLDEVPYRLPETAGPPAGQARVVL